MQVENLVLSKIDACENEMISFLQRLIGFDSTMTDGGADGNEGQAQRWLANELKNLGLEVDVFEPEPHKVEKFKQKNNYFEDDDIPSLLSHNYSNRPNVVGVFKGKGNGRSIIINGHMDTVETGSKELWKYDPFSGHIENGKIYGIGASDMKGGLAASIMAIKALKEAGIKLGGDVIIQSVVAEEIGGYGTPACLEKGYIADGAIVAEPTRLQICTKQRGVTFLEMRVKGKPIHGSVKWKGINAIEKMIKIIGSLKELESIWTATLKDALLPDQSLSFGQIEGGTGVSIVPEECIIRLMIDYLPLASQSRNNRKYCTRIHREVEDWILSFCKGDVWLKENLPELIWYSSTAPFETDPESSFVQSIKKAVAKTTSKTSISGFDTESDADYISIIGKIPVILFGPGDIANCHAVNEYLDIAEYVLCIKAFANILLEWCS
jgi:acetylornithine deacetylase